MKKELDPQEKIMSENTFAKPEVWDKVSESYAIEIDKSEYELADEIYSLFEKNGIIPPAKIIELGCGSGHLSACLAMKGYHVTLLDFSDGALAKARDTFEYYDLKGDFIKGDIFNLSAFDQTYDLVWNSGVMEHFSGNNLQKIYKSIMGITNKKFIFLVPNPNSISYLMMRYNLQGNRQWPYGMEYLRTDYLDIATKSGLKGKVIGYAALSISKWHFSSTFSDSTNTNLYAAMVDEGLIPKGEGYLVVYCLTDDKDNDFGNADSMSEDDCKKEKLFELSAINYSMGKALDAKRQEINSKDEIIKNYENQIHTLENRIISVNEEKNNSINAVNKSLMDVQELDLKYRAQHEENERLGEVCKTQIEENERLGEVCRTQIEEIKKLQEKLENLNSQCRELAKENQKLYEGIQFNKAESNRFQEMNFNIANTLVPQIKSEIEKMETYLCAPGFSKMIRFHAILGIFKLSDIKTKCKILIKALLRCVGIKKSFYTENVRMDFKLRHCIYDINNAINTMSSINAAIPQTNPAQNTEIVLPEEQSRTEEILFSEEPKVSVLLPVYNHASFITSAIEGVQQQTYRNWELILINDGSTDNLLEVLKQYVEDPRIRMYTQDNQRLPNTLTNLHHLAEGQFVTWTSADNIMEPQMLEVLIQNLLRRPDVVMAFADVAIIDDKGDYLGHGYREINRDIRKPYIMRLPHDTNALDAECDNYINACFMYRMDAVKALDGQYSADLEGLEDYDFWLRLRSFGKIIHVKNCKPLYRYRVHANTMSEDLLKNKLEAHSKRAKQMIEYSQAKNSYIATNWEFVFNEPNTKLAQSLDAINYNYERESGKKVYVTAKDINHVQKGNSLFIIVKQDTYEINYLPQNECAQKRATIYKGIDIPVTTKKVRQIKIPGLFWEYPVEFANMPVIGCHVDLRRICIEKTISLVNHNPDKLFSFCAIMGGKDKLVEQKILEKCKNVIFMGEKEFGTPLNLYASWNMCFIPPMNNVSKYELLSMIVFAWNIGKWIILGKNHQFRDALPFVHKYSYNEPLLGINEIEDLSFAESILDRYIYYYSTRGVAKRIIAFLNGVGQDIFVKRPDFKLSPKERKFPPKQLFCEYALPENLKKGYIAIMVDTLDKGGLEQVVAMLVQEFVARGMAIQIWCTNTGGLIADSLKEKGLAVLEFNGSRKTFENYVSENPPILVNTHFTKNMLDIVKEKNIPMVEVIHNMYVFFNDEAWRIEREREKYFDKMIAVSALVKETYIQKHGDVSSEKIEVIGNCADAEKLYGANRMFVRKELNISANSTVFINVSSIDGRKNQLGLITAFHMYYQSVNKNSYLIMVGNCLSEFYDSAVKQYISELDSKKHIIKLEYYESISDLYNAADIFLMPSYFEGWSIAATEALYCGLPIIHSKCGSGIELTENGENGLLISNPAEDIQSCSSENLMESMGTRVPSNTNELVNAMAKMADKLDIWKEKQWRITTRSLKNYSKKRMVECYIECLNHILDEKG